MTKATKLQNCKLTNGHLSTLHIIHSFIHSFIQAVESAILLSFWSLIFWFFDFWNLELGLWFRDFGDFVISWFLRSLLGGSLEFGGLFAGVVVASPPSSVRSWFVVRSSFVDLFVAFFGCSSQFMTSVCQPACLSANRQPGSAHSRLPHHLWHVDHIMVWHWSQT